MCFMMWMMGNGIQIFSIIMILSGLAQPVMAILKSGEGECLLGGWGGEGEGEGGTGVVPRCWG